VYKRLSLFLPLLVLLLFVPGSAQAQTQTCATGVPLPSVVRPAVFSCSITFSPGENIGVFDFSGSGDGILTFAFDTVLDTFTLTVSANEVAPSPGITNVSGDLAGATCIPYNNNFCVRYDVTGNVGGPNGTPVRGTDYRGLITMTLSYNSFAFVQIPVFGHDPELDPNFDENILTSYVDENAAACTNCEDPTMGGRTPGISSFAAFTEPFANNAQGLTVCPFVTITPQNSNNGNNPIEEVTFHLVAANGNCSTGPYLRDKTASLSVGTINTNGTISFTNLVNGGDSNKFHFDNKTGSNVQDINTNGLPSGTYYVTIISSQFSPVTQTFKIP
jgi:hypothetical protein